MILVYLGTAGAAVAAGVWGYTRWVRPLRRLRGAVAALAGGEADLDDSGAAESEREAIAQLRAVASRLRQMETRSSEEILNLQAVLGSLSEGVLIIDTDGKIRLANPGLQRMLGLANPPLHRPLLEVLRHHSVRDATRRTLLGGESHTLALSLTVRQPDGRYGEKHFQLTAAPLTPRGVDEPAGAIVILHDITQIKSLENVRRDFVANISHELRTPLSIINGYLETLLEPGGAADPETVHRFHEVMWKHGQRLRLILDDLLTLARLESPEGAGLMRFGPVSVGSCLSAVAERLLPVAAERRAAVRLELPADLPLIEADADRLDQVFFNLIDNALKHAAPVRQGKCQPGVEVIVRGGVGVTDGVESVDLQFSDNGQGIPLVDQPHLFERFYRVHKDRFRQSGGGTGLGLSIVKHIVRAHGGQVSVESVACHGATFHVRLPVRQGAAPAAAALVVDEPERKTPASIAA